MLRLVVGLVVALPAVGLAGSPNVALVDMARVFKENEDFQARTAELKAEVAKVARQATTMKGMADGLQRAISKTENVNDRAKLERDLLKLQGEMQTLHATKKQEFVHREAKLYREVYVNAQKAVAAHAREHGYTLVIRFNGNEVSENDDPKEVLQSLNRLVVFTEPEHDITQAVIERLNADDD